MPGGFGGAPAGTSTADLGARVIAFLIDWIAIPFGIRIVLGIVGAILGAVSTALALLFSLVGFVLTLGYFGYQCYLEGTTGQTIGKKMQKIKVVGVDNGGQPIGVGMALARNLVNSVPCYLGWVLGFFDAQKQTLGDKVSKSVTVPA